MKAEAEAIIAFSLCILAELGNDKSSLLGMWALDPRIFESLSQRLRPTDQVRFTLYSHCSRYGNIFQSSCVLNAASPTSEAAAVAAMGTTSGSESITTIAPISKP
uniref:Uncharacterized protein n=1 Tax=Strigamia maritima TaxID=126957 RepID=T1ITP9_STRMM